MTLWINVFYINDQKLWYGYIEVRLIKIIFISHHAVMSLMYCWDISANEVYRVIYSILSCTYMHTHTQRQCPAAMLEWCSISGQCVSSTPSWKSTHTTTEINPTSSALSVPAIFLLSNHFFSFLKKHTKPFFGLWGLKIQFERDESL